ncbi:MAG TPA: sulfotransferase [Steroidobacteraceae bacterium]|nr:sulfotransferase [Steroidobacteraceae bacterium]
MSGSQLVFVNGMGRSGTSALARVLSLCGGELPQPLLSTDEGNPHGYWEPLAALNLNDEFLRAQGSSWYDPTLRVQQGRSIGFSQRAEFVGQISSFLDACPKAATVVIKEPRIAALLDYWCEAARHVGLNPKFVIPVRHPDAVCASLMARNGTSRELSSALWLKYNLLAERSTRNYSRVFVEYPNLLSDWKKEMIRISGALSIALVLSAESAVDAFLENGSQHQRHSGPTTEVFGEPWCSRVYAELSQAAMDRAPDTQVLDEVFTAFSLCSRSFEIAIDDFRTKYGPEASVTSNPRGTMSAPTEHVDPSE